MAKKSSDSSKESHTEVHVETHTKQVASSGDVTEQPDEIRDQDTDAASDPTAELTADLQRLQAEFANYRRRVEADRADLMTLAKTRVVREFLAVRDSFDAELAHRPASADPTWSASIDAIRTQFDQVLSGLGVSRFESVGQPFDPHRHEAVATEGSGDTVTAELQPGYQIGEQILRPAIVKVGSAQES